MLPHKQVKINGFPVSTDLIRSSIQLSDTQSRKAAVQTFHLFAALGKQFYSYIFWLKHINLDTGCIHVNQPSNIPVPACWQQPLPAQGLYLTSILSSCAPRCPRCKCSLTLMRWTMWYSRCTEKYKRDLSF